MWLALRSLIVLVVLSAAAFFLIATMPADPVMTALRAWNLAPTPEATAGLRKQWGLDVPVLPRYFLWVRRFVTGDWGTSFRTGLPVRQEILSRLPLSLGLGLGGLLLAIAGAVPLGFLTACQPGGIADRASRAIALLVQAVPSFILGLLAIWLLAARLHLLHPFGINPGTIAIAISLIAVHSLAVLSRVCRRGFLAVGAAPFMRTALAKGLSPTQALWRHGQRHALLALLSAVRSEAAWAIGSSAAMEVLFGLPGVSQFLVESIAARDYFVLQAYVMIVAVWLLLVNAVVQALAIRLDPRSA
jgi:peptide/nickel transport system permease protein